jgi:hypothetical protein
MECRHVCTQVSYLLEAEPIQATKSAGHHSGAKIRRTRIPGCAEDGRSQPGGFTIADCRLPIGAVPPTLAAPPMRFSRSGGGLWPVEMLIMKIDPEMCMKIMGAMAKRPLKSRTFTAELSRLCSKFAANCRFSVTIGT